jgi:tetratricopeptide (TPR) repeat protein
MHTMNQGQLRTLAVLSTLAFLPSPLPARAGEKYALLIGVKEYTPGQLNNLDYPVEDVKLLAEVLEKGGYDRDNIRLLTQSETRDYLRPSSANIRDELRRLARDCRPGDHVLFAFAGHGIQLKGEDRTYLCPTDFRKDKRETWIDVAEVYAELNDCKADLKLLLVDACRKDPHSRIDRAPDDLFESETAPPRAPPPGGVVALFGCSPTEAALEDPELGHGIFFFFVARALAGEASHGEAPDEVTMPQLEDYVKRRVQDYAWSKFKARQHPELQTRGASGLVRVVHFRAGRPGPLHIRRALALKAKGKIQEANQELIRAAAYEEKDNPVDALLRRARILYGEDRYPEAIDAYSKVLEHDPKNVEALADRGEAYFLNDDPAAALRDYNRALDIKPDCAVVYLRAGVVRAWYGENERALANFTHAIEADPRMDQAYYRRALVKEAQEDFKGALDDLKLALSLKPYKNTYRNNVARMQHKLNQVGAAIGNLTKAIRIDPRDEQSYYYRANAYYDQEDYDAAIRDYDRVLEINPGADYVFYHRGYAYQARGNTALALRDWGRVPAGSRHYARAQANIGWARGGGVGRVAGGGGWSGGGNFGGRFGGGGRGGGRR